MCTNTFSPAQLESYLCVLPEEEKSLLTLLRQGSVSGTRRHYLHTSHPHPFHPHPHPHQYHSPNHSHQCYLYRQRTNTFIHLHV